MKYSDAVYYRIRKALVTFVYVLTKDFVCYLEEAPQFTGATKFIIYENGKLTIKSGFVWDGPSGPSIDTEAFLRASLVHDALYRLMVLKVIPQAEKHRKFADKAMYEINLSGGMSKLRACYTYFVVRVFGGKHSRYKPKIYTLKGKL